MTQFDQELSQVINDKQSGSVAVLQKLIHTILNFLNREQDATTRLKMIKNRLATMHNSLGHFEVVKHFLTQLEDWMTKPEIKDATGIVFCDLVKDYDDTWKNVNVKIAESAIEQLDFNNKTILLHSNSSAIVSLFQKMADEGIYCNVIQTESRPENEGRYQAVNIADQGHHVSIIVDSAAAFMIEKANLVLTGADQIHPDYFVNKIGTYAIALVCHEKNIPFFVLADSRKISPTRTSPEALYSISKPGKGIWKNHPRNINPVNYYFEPIPTPLVKGFITEKEIINPNTL